MGKIQRKSLVAKLLYKTFRDNENKILSKEYLINTVWGQKYNPMCHDNLLYTHLCRLRKMLHPAEAIKSCYNGYRYVTDKSIVVSLQRILDDFKAITDEEKKAEDFIRSAIACLNNINVKEPEFKGVNLTPEMLWEIRSQKEKGETLKSLSDRYNVSKTTLTRALSGKIKYLNDRVTQNAIRF